MNSVRDKAKAVLAKLRGSYQVFAKSCLKIKTKSGKVLPFELNQAQQYLDDKIEDMRQRTGKVRVVVLKGRQQGVSTYTQGRFYWRTSLNRGLNAYILTHEAEATLNLFTMTKRYHELNDRLLAGSELRPVTGSDSANKLTFPELDSGYKVGTAGNKGAGRSSTVQLFHGSEVAFWPNAEEHLKGVLQAVPNEPGTEVILESTANGVGGVFYDYVMDAKRGEGEFELVFLPWFWQPEYRQTVPVDFVRTDEEQSLVNRFGLDDEQLVWRRSKIHELKSLDSFKQEYPNTVEEAFIFSGRGAFDANWLDQAEEDCFSPERVCEVTTAGLVDKVDGRLKIYDLPNLAELYAIGADIAEGLEHGDFTSIDVVDSKGYQVAAWHGHIAPDLAGELIAKIGRIYGNAFVGVERNNHGLTTLTKLRDAGYANLYAQEALESRAEGDQTKRFGWLTTSKSKPFIIDQLASMLRDRESGLASKEHVAEMREYIIEANGSYNARKGANDDRVMSYAIAQEMARRMPKFKPEHNEEIQHHQAGVAGY
jgi:hypothetical protein